VWRGERRITVSSATPSRRSAEVQGAQGAYPILRAMIG
jgi:hypothetical protein